MSKMKSMFDGILSQFGHDIFLQRRTSNAAGQVTFSTTLERHTVRFTSAITGLQNSQQEQNEGLVNTTAKAYYFKSEANPFEGDRVYEQDPRSSEMQTVWVIEQAVPMRGENGVIIYWACGVGRILPN